MHILEAIPSSFKSNLFRQSRTKREDNISTRKMMDSKIVAKRIFLAERSGKDIVYIPLKARLFLLLESLFYPLFKRLFLK
jgi:hypothetical protein